MADKEFVFEDNYIKAVNEQIASEVNMELKKSFVALRETYIAMIAAGFSMSEAMSFLAACAVHNIKNIEE